MNRWSGTRTSELNLRTTIQLTESSPACAAGPVSVVSAECQSPASSGVSDTKSGHMDASDLPHARSFAYLA